MLCLLLARQDAEERQSISGGDARHKAVRLPVIDKCNPRSSFRSLNQSEWQPDHRLSDLTRHSDAKVGKDCDAFWPKHVSFSGPNPLVHGVTSAETY